MRWCADPVASHAVTSTQPAARSFESQTLQSAGHSGGHRPSPPTLRASLSQILHQGNLRSVRHRVLPPLVVVASLVVVSSCDDADTLGIQNLCASPIQADSSSLSNPPAQGGQFHFRNVNPDEIAKGYAVSQTSRSPARIRSTVAMARLSRSSSTASGCCG